MNDIIIRTDTAPSGKVRISILGYAKEQKELLKSLGYKWSRTPENLSVLGLTAMKQLCWNKYVNEDILQEELSKLSSVADRTEDHTDFYTKLYRKMQTLFSYNLTEDRTKNWNGLVYGKPGEYFLFRNGEKLWITTTEADELRSEKGSEVLTKYGLRKIGEKNE